MWYGLPARCFVSYFYVSILYHDGLEARTTLLYKSLQLI